MKQTQTKLFDFADVGLDFCAGSKSLFQDRFKRMLALGYNSQTVVSVSVVGNQVTFEYGVSHGYVVDRVLKVISGPLALINNGEFVVDSVTATTLTMTIDGAPISIAGNFKTTVAPLGYELVYESGFIQIFKFKDLDESDLYIRFAYQTGPTHRNTIMPCIGRTVDLETGTITDTTSYPNGRTGNNAGQAMPKWEFTANWASTYNTYTYSQGSGVFGKGVVIGSPYHLLILSNTDTSHAVHTVINGFVPSRTLNFDSLNLPVLFLYNTNASGNDNRSTHYGNLFTGYIGGVRVSFKQDTVAAGDPFNAPLANSSFISLDTFNTTTAEPIGIYEYSTKQFLGYVSGGLYLAKYAVTNQPQLVRASAPIATYDIDLENSVYLHGIGIYAVSTTSLVVLAVPVEEIKIGD